MNQKEKQRLSCSFLSILLFRSFERRLYITVFERPKETSTRISFMSPFARVWLDQTFYPISVNFGYIMSLKMENIMISNNNDLHIF